MRSIVLVLLLTQTPSTEAEQDRAQLERAKKADESLADALAQARIAFETDCPFDAVKLERKATGQRERLYRFAACGGRYVCAVADSGPVSCKPLMAATAR
jgi:hypothetical protein